MGELYALIISSLRIFQSLTGFYRERVSFTTSANVPFYDLRTLFPNEYAFSVTDDQLLTEIERHLIEPATNPWTGTAQFSVTDIAEALQTVRDDFQLSTGVYASHLSLLSVSPSTSRISLSPSVIDLRRVAWKDTASSITTPMVRTDEFAANAYFRSWAASTGRPYAYSIAISPPITVALIPPNASSGSLDMVAVPSGPPLPCNPSTPALIGIPDDLAYGITWGALSRLLAHDSISKDSPRSAIAEELHRLALLAARPPLSSLNMSIAGSPLGIESIEDTDRYHTLWMQLRDKPQVASFVSPNVFALIPVPDNVYTVTVDLARSFPIPDVNNPNSTYLQVGFELIDPILEMPSPCYG